MGRTIHLYKWASCTAAEIMNGAGNQLFTRARLSQDQHGGVGRSHEIDFRKHNPQCGAAPYDLF